MADDTPRTSAALINETPELLAGPATTETAAGPGPEPEPEAPPPTEDEGPFDVAAMLRQTPLTEGESPQAYDALVAEVENAVAPKDFFDRLMAADLARELWQEQRLSRQRVALTDAMRFKAVLSLITPVCEARAMRPVTAALNYFEFDGREVANRFFARYGITDEAVNAQAAVLQGQAMALFDQRVSNAQSRRSAITKELARRKRKIGKEKAQLPTGPDIRPLKTAA